MPLAKQVTSHTFQAGHSSAGADVFGVIVVGVPLLKIIPLMIGGLFSCVRVGIG
jgi:hypothetical protein